MERLHFPHWDFCVLMLVIIFVVGCFLPKQTGAAFWQCSTVWGYLLSMATRFGTGPVFCVVAGIGSGWGDAFHILELNEDLSFRFPYSTFVEVFTASAVPLECPPPPQWKHPRCGPPSVCPLMTVADDPGRASVGPSARGQLLLAFSSLEDFVDLTWA